MNDSLEQSATQRVEKVFSLLISLKKASSNAEICRKCNINRNYLTELRKGNFRVSVEVAEALIDKYNISRNYLYNGTGSIFGNECQSAQSENIAEESVLRKQVSELIEQNTTLVRTNATLVQLLAKKGEAEGVLAEALRK